MRLPRTAGYPTHCGPDDVNNLLNKHHGLTNLGGSRTQSMYDDDNIKKLCMIIP